MRKKTYYINKNNGWGGQHSSDYTKTKMTKDEFLEYKVKYPTHFVTDKLMAMYYYCND